MKKILSNELHQIFDVEGTNGLSTAIVLDSVIGLFTLSLWSDEISIRILAGVRLHKAFHCYAIMHVITSDSFHSIHR
jgi:hypothetical protein